MRENRIDCIISTFLFKQKLNKIVKPTNRLSFSPRFSSFILLYLSVSSLLPPGRGSHSPAQRKGLHRKSRGFFEGPLVVSCKTRAGAVGEDLARERERERRGRDGWSCGGSGAEWGTEDGGVAVPHQIKSLRLAIF